MLALVETRATQTNEVGRCALLLPVFQRMPAPLALVEVGASAGLNLLFDRYSYDYSWGDGTSGRIGEGTPLLTCAGPPGWAGDEFPAVASRVGIDREPVDVTDDDAVAWLRACIFADQLDRLERLDQAVVTARRDPPRIVSGDALDVLAGVVAEIPDDAHVCVFHTHVLTYFGRDERAAFVDLMDSIGRERNISWLSAEAPGTVAPLGLERAPTIAMGLIAYTDGTRSTQVLGTCHPHGAWFTPA